MKKYWILFWHFRKLSFMKMTEYRTDFFFWSFVSVMWTVFNFFFFSLLINLQNTIAGWGRWELYALLGVYTLLDAFTWSFFAQNMWLYTHRVFSGELSTFLLKPVDTQYMVMTSETSYNNIPRLVIGTVAVVYSLRQLGITPGLLDVLLFLLTMIAGLVMIYSLWFLIATLSFWVEKLDNINEIVPSFRRLWELPRSIYLGFTSILFTFILPLGLITSVPSEILLQRAEPGLVVYLLGFSLGLFAVARWFFHFSLRKYTSVGG